MSLHYSHNKAAGGGGGSVPSREGVHPNNVTPLLLPQECWILRVLSRHHGHVTLRSLHWRSALFNFNFHSQFSVARISGLSWSWPEPGTNNFWPFDCGINGSSCIGLSCTVLCTQKSEIFGNNFLHEQTNCMLGMSMKGHRNGIYVQSAALCCRSRLHWLCQDWQWQNSRLRLAHFTKALWRSLWNICRHFVTHKVCYFLTGSFWQTENREHFAHDCHFAENISFIFEGNWSTK